MENAGIGDFIYILLTLVSITVIGSFLWNWIEFDGFLSKVSRKKQIFFIFLLICLVTGLIDEVVAIGTDLVPAVFK